MTRSPPTTDSEAAASSIRNSRSLTRRPLRVTRYIPLILYQGRAFTGVRVKSSMRSIRSLALAARPERVRAWCTRCSQVQPYFIPRR